MSTNDYTSRLPRQRWSHEAKGRILYLPMTGLVVVPFYQQRKSWDAVVVGGSDTYTPGGHCLSIGDREIETAIEVHSAADLIVQGKRAADDAGIPSFEEVRDNPDAHPVIEREKPTGLFAQLLDEMD